MSEFKTRLAAALEDPLFFPYGGDMVICLRHPYPLAKVWASIRSKKALRTVATRLKGVDAEIWRALCDFGLDAELRVVYSNDATLERVLVDHCASINPSQSINCLGEHLAKYEGGKRAYPGFASPSMDWDRGNYRPPPTMFVNWEHWDGHMEEIKHRAERGELKIVQTAYWRIGVFVRVGLYGARTVQFDRCSKKLQKKIREEWY